MPDHRGRTQHEQSAQVAITLFGDPSLALFAAAAVLSGHQPDPGRKVPSGVDAGLTATSIPLVNLTP